MASSLDFGSHSLAGGHHLQGVVENLRRLDIPKPQHVGFRVF